MSLPKRYIITGAPSTGKTTLIQALSQQGFHCKEEVSRRVIIAQQQVNGNKTPWEDVSGFTQLVYTQTVKELAIDDSQITFVDRGLPDNMAYLKLHKKAIPNNFLDFNYKKYYHDTVFLLPLWKTIYKQDPQRLQNFEEARKLQDLLLETYLQLGFNINLLEKDTVSNRVSYILKNIK